MMKKYKTFNRYGHYDHVETFELTNGYVDTIEEAREAGKKATHMISFEVDSGDYTIREYTMDEATFTITEKCVERYIWAEHHPKEE